MKLSLTLLATASYCAPERKKQKKSTNDRLVRSTPVPCTEVNGGSPFTFLDNGASGQVTFDSYSFDVYCYVDIGASCDAEGVKVEITHMELETNTDYLGQDHQTGDYIYAYDSCFDTIHFSWLNKDGETVEQTDPQCGCLGDNHSSCNDHPFDDNYIAVTERPTQYNLIGTDAKIVLGSDESYHGGRIQVDWSCINPITTTTTSEPVTNTLDMAKTVLNGDFTPEMGQDYGCSGRGLFDPFAQTIGSHVDDVDAAFFAWKKCVQCASGNNKSNVLAYSYDVESDTCGKEKKRKFKV